mmetsp:Transcript_33205/g.38673  ORF Transcript_33205/g.38673 Transcript_33205/m.38673 type:complete len:134 (+) Transcript_33205:41-442(+)|eukprot:CAMPEP_0176430972 /NCGR_PEP_ID=MMETSP0127-20121128/14551_1 /TAXON_ID=938130 /ORGANISM="Platyophrya macrostoma, Strain WH" /LENGTH=133 /DNA_ID=CAMNT_0017812923 /DNA_START=15 /DNA_END=416 /DNA_ORIENTATION=+
MNESARLALANRARRRVSLNLDAEAHVERLAAACGLRPTSPTIHVDNVVGNDWYGSDDEDGIVALHETTPTWKIDKDATVIFQEGCHRFDCRLTALLLLELKERAALQLLEATRFSDVILGPFCSISMRLLLS